MGKLKKGNIHTQDWAVLYKRPNTGTTQVPAPNIGCCHAREIQDCLVHCYQHLRFSVEVGQQIHSGGEIVF